MDYTVLTGANRIEYSETTTSTLEVDDMEQLDFVINSLQTIRAELLSEGDHRQELLNETTNQEETK